MGNREVLEYEGTLNPTIIGSSHPTLVIVVSQCKWDQASTGATSFLPETFGFPRSTLRIPREQN